MNLNTTNDGIIENSNQFVTNTFSYVLHTFSPPHFTHSVLSVSNP